MSLVDVVSMLVIYRDVVDGGVVLLVGVWSSVDGDDGDDGVVLWQGAVALLVVGCCCWACGVIVCDTLRGGVALLLVVWSCCWWCGVVVGEGCGVVML